MTSTTDRLLVGAALIAFGAAALHVALIFGGPSWYEFARAPAVLVRMVRAGHPYPAFSCLAIAALLACCACYALSGARVIGRLPLLRLALTAAAFVFIARALLMIPMIAMQPAFLADICNCQAVDTFMVVSSAICLAAGAGFAAGAARLWRGGGAA